ncbi:MAG: ABC transporter substrate-binding protein [Treponema sp.]|jgi:iron complex transport system substrate-binding protein|nr:ABC transporter substrate-binding protein [Treponema sp.]
MRNSYNRGFIYRKRFTASAALLFLSFISVHAETLTDALGRTFILNAPATRVVSLSPSVTEILFALEAGGQTVGRTEFCDYPPSAAAIPSVGGFSGATVSVERIARLKPDLVVISADMHERLVSLLEALGISIFAVEPRNFSQVFSCIETLGRLTGREKEARRVVGAMQAQLASVEKSQAVRVKPRVFWLLSDSPFLTSGKNTFVNEIIERAGGINIFADREESWPLVNVEQILLRLPDWILSTTDVSLQNSLNFNQFKNIRKARFNPSLVYRYGPRLSNAVQEVARVLSQ